MSPRQIYAIAAEHQQKHRGMFPLLFRVVVYASGLACVLSLAGGSATTVLSLFLLISVTFELLCHIEHSGPRRWAYILVIVAMAFSGLFLVREAMQLHAAEPHQVIQR